MHIHRLAMSLNFRPNSDVVYLRITEDGECFASQTTSVSSCSSYYYYCSDDDDDDDDDDSDINTCMRFNGKHTSSVASSYMIRRPVSIATHTCRCHGNDKVSD